MEKASREQIDLAEKLGIDVSTDSSIVAAAKIKSAVYEAITPGKKRKKATDKQIDFLKSLGVATEINDFLVVSAMIDEELQKRNIAALERLDLKPGDIIVFRKYGFEEENTISSIASNYRIWFKGGRGRGCWPSQVLRKVES